LNITLNTQQLPCQCCEAVDFLWVADSVAVHILAGIQKSVDFVWWLLAWQQYGAAP
jgi:hypothetical protein